MTLLLACCYLLIVGVNGLESSESVYSGYSSEYYGGAFDYSSEYYGGYSSDYYGHWSDSDGYSSDYYGSDYSDGETTVSWVMILGNITLHDEVWLDVYTDVYSTEFQTLNQTLTWKILTTPLEDGISLFIFNVTRFLPDEGSVKAEYYLFMMGAEGTEDEIKDGTIMILNNVEGVSKATATLLITPETLGNFTDWTGDSDSGEMFVATLIGNFTLTTETWIPAYENSFSLEFQELNTTIFTKVYAKAAEEGYEENMLSFEIIRILYDVSVIVEFRMVTLNDKWSTQDSITSDVVVAINEVEGFDFAYISDFWAPNMTTSSSGYSDWLYPSMSMTDGYYTDYESSGGTMYMVTLFGNFTLTTETWTPEYENIASGEFQELNATIFTKVIAKAFEKGYTDNLLSFEILQIVYVDAVIVKFKMDTLDDVISLKTITDDTIEALNEIDGFDFTFISEVLTPDDMPIGSSGYTDWMYPSASMSESWMYTSGHMSESWEYPSGSMSESWMYPSGSMSESWMYPSGSMSESWEYPSGSMSESWEYPSGSMSESWEYPSGSMSESWMYPSGSMSESWEYPSGSMSESWMYPSGSMSESWMYPSDSIIDGLESSESVYSGYSSEYYGGAFDYSSEYYGGYSSDYYGHWSDSDGYSSDYYGPDYSDGYSSDYYGSDYSDGETTVSWVMILGNITLHDEVWLDVYTDVYSTEFHTLNQTLTWKILTTPLEDGISLFIFNVTRFLPDEGSVKAEYYLFMMGAEGTEDEIKDGTIMILNNVEGVSKATATLLITPETLGNFTDWTGDSDSGEMFVATLIGNFTLTTETWIPAYENSFSLEFQELNTTIFTKVYAKAAEEGYEENMLSFEIIRILYDVSVIVEFRMVTLNDKWSTKDSITSDVVVAINEVEGFDFAYISDFWAPNMTTSSSGYSDWLYPSMSMTDGYYTDYESSGGTMYMVTLFGNFTLTTETWTPEYENIASGEFQELNATIFTKVIAKAFEKGYTDNLLSFEILQIVYVDAVIVKFKMDTLDDAISLKTITDDTIEALNEIDGFDFTFISEVLTPDGMPIGSSGYTDWMYPSASMSESWMYTSGSMSESWMYPSGSMSESWMYPSGSMSESWEYPSGSMSESWMYPSGSMSESWEYPSGSMSESWEYPSGSMSESWMYPSGSMSESWMYPSGSMSESWEYPSGSMSESWMYPSGSMSESWMYPSGSMSESWMYPSGSMSESWEYPSGSMSESWEYPSGSMSESWMYPSGSMSESWEYPSGSMSESWMYPSGSMSESWMYPSDSMIDESSLSPTESSSYMEQSSTNFYTEAPSWTGPVINASFILGVVTIGGVPKLSLQCGPPTEPTYDYSFEWFADEILAYKSSRMSFDQAVVFYITGDDMDVDGFALEKSYKCAISYYYPGYSEALLTVVSDETVPIEVEDTDLVVTRGKELIINAHINMPLPCPDGETCYVDIKVVDLEDSNSCDGSSLAFVNRYTCGQRIFGSANFSNNVGHQTIRVTTKNNNQYWLTKSTFRVKIEVEPVGLVENFWRGTFSEEFTVQVVEDDTSWKWAVAYSINDPRHYTFDGVWYSVDAVGVFQLYKDKERGAEVQITTEDCLWGGTCTCAVAVRAGLDIFTIDHCHGTHTTTYLRSSGNGNLFVTMEDNEYYEITLPRGTVVSVIVSPSFWFPFTMVNVLIFPSPNDVNNVEGLCGTLNGHWEDDLLHSDGTTTTITEWDLWGNEPANFVESWRIQEENSLWQIYDSDSIQDLNEDDTLTTCSGSAEVFKSKNEKRTCVGSVDTVVEIERRSVDSHAAYRKREVLNMMDTHALQKRMAFRNTKRSTELKIRKKRQVDTSDSCTYEQAETACSGTMTNKCGTTIDATNGIGNNTDKIKSCIADKMNNCTVNWEDSACAVASTTTKKSIEKDTTIDAEVAEEVRKSLCPNNCCQRGTCVEGACVCNAGYSKADCSFDNARASKILDTGNEMCQKPCNQIHISADEISADTLCKATRRIVTSPNYTVIDEGETNCQLTYKNTWEAEVDVTSSRKRRSTTDDSNVVAEVFDVSLTNDGSNYGDSSSFIVLDSTCLTYTMAGDDVTVTLDSNYCLIDGQCYMNGSAHSDQSCNLCDVTADVFSWTLTSGNCLIDDVCYADGTFKSGDTCRFCNVTADISEWTLDTETASCQDSDSDSDGMEGYIIAIIVLVVLLVAGLIAVGGYFLWKKHQFARSNGIGLFDSVGRQRFSLRVEPTKVVPDDEYCKEDHPPPTYTLPPAPQPGTEKVPSNLYADRASTPRTSALAAQLQDDLEKGQGPSNLPNIVG